MLALGASAFATAALPRLARAAGLPVPPSKTLSFVVSRNGDRCGTHSIVFSGNPPIDLTVSTEIDLTQRVSLLAVSYYKASYVERWNYSRFGSLDAHTDHDGVKSYTTVNREGHRLIVNGSASGEYQAPRAALPATHWNGSELKGPMIDPVSGNLLTPVIADLGQDSLALASGETVMAEHFSWRGAGALDLWYANDGTWAGFATTAAGGARIVYARI